MQQCSIYDKSLRFSRFVYSVMVLCAYFLQDKWLVLTVSILTIMGAFSLSFNIPYHLHRLYSKRSNIGPSNKDFGELSFVSGITGILLLAGFLLLQYTEYTTFAWVYILVVVAMLFMACLVGFCVATLMYILIRNKFNHKRG